MNGFLLDTNVISETVRPRPEPRVLSWFRERTPRDLFLSAVTLGELVRGALSVGDPARSLRYQQWISRDLTRQFGGRILAFDDRAAVIWGEIMGAADKAGRPRPALDAQIAAVALRHNLVLATRNTGDFQDLELPLVDPWRE